MSAYTKGNWRIHPHSSTSVDAPSIHHVVAACGGWGDNRRDVRPEQEANAKLIACAPEMAEALLIIRRNLFGRRWQSTAGALDDLLKKAGVIE